MPNTTYNANQFKLFLEKEIVPISNQLDTDEQLLKQYYWRLVLLGALKIFIPTELGGCGGDRLNWIEHTILLAQYSGALLFLQAQHQFAIAKLKLLLPHLAVKNLLQAIANQNIGLGIGLAANKKIFQVNKTQQGFSLSGKLLWVTGYQFFSSILCSFDYDDNIYYFLLPFTSTTQDDSLFISAKIATTVFDATNTVSIHLDHYFVADDNILTYELSPLKPLTEPFEHPAIYNLAGAAKALLTLARQGKYFTTPASQQKYAALLTQWQHYYQTILDQQSCAFTLRANGFTLANNCADFARIVCGAEGIFAHHPINRICREIWQYSVGGYSEQQLIAYLDT